MDLTKLFTEERAVSPVIAVVLMIAITVILTAVVAAFALSLGASEARPQVNLDFDWDDGGTVGGNDDELVITHEGGDSVPAGRIDVLVDGTVDTVGGWGADPVVTGTRYVIYESGTNAVDESDEIRVVWTGEDGQGATLGVYTVPS